MATEPTIPRPLRSRLDEHFGLTVAAVVLTVIIATVSITWSIANNVLLKVKDNQIEALQKQLAAQITAVPPKSSDVIPAPSIQLQVTATPSPTIAPPATHSPIVAPSPSSTPADSWIPPSKHPVTVGGKMEDLERQWTAIADRFSEQAAFIDRYDNSQVSWTVVVRDIVDAGGERVNLYYAPATGSGFPLGSLAFFHADNKDRLMALSRGDVITIDGVLRASGKGFVLYSRDFRFVHAATPTPTP
jgi:hypothetical protein